MIKKSLVVGLLSAGFVAVPGMALASTQFNPAPVPVATTVSSSITASQADQAAIAAVGGGTVTSTSSDTYQGSAVFDIHVLYNSTVYDVKVLKATGGVALKKVSSEQSTSANSSDQKDAVDSSTPEHSSTPSQDKQTPATPSSSNGITFGVKLTVAPSAFQSFVNQALAQNNGTLKWIKLISHQGGDVQANIKVNLSQGGTVKVIDLFSPSNQLISQTVGS